MDPWGPQCVELNVDIQPSTIKFEDDFVKQQEYNQNLPDSKEYIAALERRLRSLHTKSSLVEELSAYRVDCLERLLRDYAALDPPNPGEDKYPLIKIEKK